MRAPAQEAAPSHTCVLAVLLRSSNCVCRRGTIADWTAKNRDADLHVRDGSSSDRRATKRRPALQNDRAACRMNDGAVNVRDRLPALDKAWCMLAALPALLLHLIIIGTHRRKNESQHSNERNQAHYAMASEMTATARSSQSSCAHIALEDALHGSFSAETRFGHTPVSRDPASLAWSS